MYLHLQPIVTASHKDWRCHWPSKWHRFLALTVAIFCSIPELEDAVRKARTEEIRIPFGVGIAGCVAQNKEIINIKDAYKVTLILQMCVCVCACNNPQICIWIRYSVAVFFSSDIISTETAIKDIA